MHTTLWLGMSINGMIADKNGNEEFLSDQIWNLFVAQVRATKSVVMGRKAYEGLLKWPKEYMAELSGISKVVLSTSKNLTLNDDWKSAKSPEEALLIFKNAGITTVTVAGGSKTSRSFLQEKLVDEVIYAIEPIIKGEGVGSIAQSNIEQKLKLIDVENINGIIMLRYNIL